jgi:fructose-specific phosphotransferase system IIC component
LRRGLEQRTAAAEVPDDNAPPYDLLRASVNLTVASLLISIGTANKLPLSTTYITFMAAMGASLADGSWSRDSADSRVTGILAVLGGWVVTGFVAALAAFAIASLAYLSTTISAYGPLLGLALIGAIVVLSLMMLGRSHRVQLGTRATVVDEL